MSNDVDTMNYFCTFFDIRYLDRGLALYHSLLARGEPFHLWILCMDRETEETLSTQSLRNSTLVTISDLEHADPRVTIVRQDRSLVEFYFTSKSFLCQYVFGMNPDVELLTYFDADGFFFGSPGIILEEMKGYSIGLTGHRFPARLNSMEQHGLFNAGFVSFRRDAEGLGALTWWQDRCIEWCRDYTDCGRYADQGYLNDIPQRFNRVVIIRHKGINAAPWNITQYRVTVAGDRILIDSDPLIFYHFHGVKKITTSWFDSGLSLYGASLTGSVKKHIYTPYLNELMRTSPLRSESQRSVRIERGAYDWFHRLFPSTGKRLQTMRKIMLGIRYRSLIKYKKPQN